ncbi:MAG: isoaspartyl peptidase/L-asparaginase [Bacteroidota bacterium]
MKIKFSILALSIICLMTFSHCNNPTPQKPDYVLVLHGGAGGIRKGQIPPEKEAAFTRSLQFALDIGGAILKSGGTAEDAVVATVKFLEDDSLFNAGKGSVYNSLGRVEMDASIMTGHNLEAGAVAGIQTTRHPVLLAQAIKDNSPHVMMARSGAEEFGQGQGLQMMDTSYFFTQKSANTLKKVQDREREKETALLEKWPDWKYGTVGAVALDKAGNLAAVTSTGGMTNKRYSRVGDSPIIGAGTYANNATCAVSCTGHGEYFIRNVVAYDVSARMEYLGESVQTAADFIVNQKLLEQKGSGGLIAVDKNGNIAMPFNTSGMFRAYLKEGEAPFVGMYQ